MAGRVSLSARLKALADMVTRGNRVCDMGCDHGYLSIYLAEQRISPGVLAMDVKEGPLGQAREHVALAGLGDYIALRLSDGLTDFQAGEAQTLICAGMGGRLMERILAKDPHKSRSFQELILQPQSEIASFRRFLRREGYSILREDMIWEDGKFYPVIKAAFTGADGREPAKETGEGRGTDAEFRVRSGDLPGGQSQELADRFGPCLLKMRHPVLYDYLKKELESARELESVLRKKAFLPASTEGEGSRESAARGGSGCPGREAAPASGDLPAEEKALWDRAAPGTGSVRAARRLQEMRREIGYLEQALKLWEEDGTGPQEGTVLLK